MANYINKYANQAEYITDETKQFPNVSYIVSGDSIVFAESEEIPSGLKVYYYIEDPTQEVTLLFGGGSSSGGGGDSSSSGGGGAIPTSMKVDGSDETVVSSWRFSTSGTHIVEYTFEDGFMNVYFDGLYATKAIFGTDITSIDSAVWGSPANDQYYTTATPPEIVANSEYVYPTDAYVPAASVSAYQAASGWSDISSSIHPIQ